MSAQMPQAIESASIKDPRFTSAESTRLSRQPVDDAHLTRILWMPTFDIDVKFMSGSSFIGAFKDELICKRTLIFFRDGEAVSYMQKEIPALITTEESDLSQSILPAAEVIDSMGIQNQDASLVNCRMVRNSPRFCANTLLRQYARVGLTNFEHLMGREEDAKLYYTVILPLNAIPITERVRLNERFEGPFLDEIIKYLREQGEQNIRSWKGASATQSAKSDARKMLQKMIVGAGTGWRHQNSVVNDSESLIREKRNGGEGKQWYDQRDERFENALPGQDCVFLADTGREPLDVQDIAAAAKLSKDTATATTAAMEGVFERVFGPGGAMANVADPRIAALEQKFDALIKLAETRPDLRGEIAEVMKGMAPPNGGEGELPAPAAEKIDDPATHK